MYFNLFIFKNRNIEIEMDEKMQKIYVFIIRLVNNNRNRIIVLETKEIKNTKHKKATVKWQS